MSAELFFTHVLGAVERMHKAIDHISLVIPAAGGLKPTLLAAEMHIGEARKAFEALTGEEEGAPAGDSEAPAPGGAPEPAMPPEPETEPVEVPDEMDAGVPTAAEDEALPDVAHVPAAPGPAAHAEAAQE